MTQEDKQLLLKDLCARLLYGVKGRYCLYDSKGNLTDWGNEPEIVENIDLQREKIWTDGTVQGYYLDEFKPFLRPMSSMTEEEIEEYRNLSDEVIGSYGPYHREFIAHCVRLGIKPDNPHECVDDLLNMEAIDWLIEHHFDYRGLIPMGLALEAPEGMYDETLV